MNDPKYLGDHALITPDKPALIHGGTGEVLTYRDIDERSNRLAQCLFALGLRRGDRIAIVMENNLRYMEVCWAALRSGLLIAPVNRYLTADEAAYIVADSEARAVVSSLAMRELADGLSSRMPGCGHRLMVDGTIEGWTSYEQAIAAHPAQRLADEWMGGTMFYSSGTTGRPKGIIRAQQGGRVSEGQNAARLRQMSGYGLGPDTVYLSPAPMYHAARWSARCVSAMKRATSSRPARPGSCISSGTNRSFTITTRRRRPATLSIRGTRPGPASGTSAMSIRTVTCT